MKNMILLIIFFLAAPGIVTANSTTSIETLTKAAANGNVEAQYKLGNYYMSQQGKDNYNKALSWYLKAAKQGHLNSMLAVGRMYTKGAYVKLDRVQGMVWLIRAYNQAEANGEKQLLNTRYLKKARIRLGFGEYAKVKKILAAENKPIPDFLQKSYLSLLLNPF